MNLLNHQTQNLILGDKSGLPIIVQLEDLFSVQQFRGRFGEIMLENMIKDILPKEFYEFQYEFKIQEEG